MKKRHSPDLDATSVSSVSVWDGEACSLKTLGTWFTGFSLDLQLIGLRVSAVLVEG
jgi:hypothetical protein